MAISFLPAAAWTGRSDPEDGPDALRLHHLVRDDAPRALIGFACEAGVARNKGRPGASEGPAALRKALANMAAPEGAGVGQGGFTDLGTMLVEGDDLETGQAALAGRIAGALSRHDRVIVLGGGHETAFASFCGLAKAYPGKRIGIINLDAHLDIRAVGGNGASSGTPFAQIRELAGEAFDYLCLGLAEESNTAALRNKARDWNVTTVSDHALIADHHAADAVIGALVERNDLVYLTIDLDVLPHYQAPGVSAPAPRGVPLVVIEHIVAVVIRGCAELGRPLPLADAVELCPPHDRDGMTARSAALLIRKLLLT